MQRQNKFKQFFPVVLIFIALNVFFISGKHIIERRWHADQDVLITGNVILFLITFLSFFIAKNGLKNTNPNAFVRSVYGSIMAKLFLCMIAAAIYIFGFRATFNKPAFFILMGLYLVYTFFEVAALQKMLRGKANG